MGQWILVLYGYRVEWSVINAQTFCLVLFQHKDSRATTQRTTGSDVPLIKQFLQLDLQFCHLFSCHRIWPLIDRRVPGYNSILNSMALSGGIPVDHQKTHPDIHGPQVSHLGSWQQQHR
jgi:hypothetical protein